MIPQSESAGPETPRAAPAAKTAIDWSARNRMTTLDVQRYSRFVVIMKRALLMAAAALLAAVIAYSLQPRQNSKSIALTFQRLGIVNNDLAMIKPKLTGIDSDGDPFVVTAEQAVQDPRDAKRAQLKNVEADMTLKDGKWLNATATRGRLDATAQKLWLAGIIDVYSDNGYELHTTAADIDMKKGTVVGNRPAAGQGPLGTFRSDRFRIESDPNHSQPPNTTHDAKHVYLYGNVRMTIFRHGMAHS